MYVSNMDEYGYVLPPLAPNTNLSLEIDSLNKILLDILDDSETKFKLDPSLEEFIKYPEP